MAKEDARERLVIDYPVEIDEESFLNEEVEDDDLPTEFSIDENIIAWDEDGNPIVPNILWDWRAAFERERDVNIPGGPGHNLRNYWIRGKGAAKIRWNTPGDWTRCVRHLRKYVKDPKGLCAEYHKQATGMWPGDRRNRKGLSSDTVALSDDVLYDGSQTDMSSHMSEKGNNMSWHIEKRGEYFYVVRDEDEKVVAQYTDKPAAIAHMKALYNTHVAESIVAATAAAVEVPEAADEDVLNRDEPAGDEDEIPMSGTAHWEGVLTVEGIESGDGRMFAPYALTWDTPPLPLMWQKETSHGGNTDKSVRIGSVTEIWRTMDPEGRPNVFFIEGRGVIDLGSEDGREAYRRMKNGFLRGNSVDVDSVKNANIEFVYSDEETEDETTEAPDPTKQLFTTPSKTIYHKGRIRATTMVEIPAFVEAQLVLVDGHSTIVPDKVPSPDEVSTEALVAATTITIPDAPPREWFDEPKDVQPLGALTITNEGRVYGYVAPAGVRHRSFMDRAQYVPMGNVDYSRFHGGETIVADGGRVVTGPITMNCNHLPPTRNFTVFDAKEHYENSCSIVASVRVGENEHGVWVAGALMPGLTHEQIARMMQCRLSGDWRPHLDKPGWREFAAALLVPVPGFPMARTAPSVGIENGELVASAVPVVFKSEQDVDPKTAVEMLMKRIKRDKESRLQELRARVHASRVAELRNRLGLADISTKEREKLAKQGKAMPGGRFPIRNREDLENAIRAVGRARPNTDEERASVRRHIMERARELELENLIPDTWNADGTLKE